MQHRRIFYIWCIHTKQTIRTEHGVWAWRPWSTQRRKSQFTSISLSNPSRRAINHAACRWCTTGGRRWENSSAKCRFYRPVCWILIPSSESVLVRRAWMWVTRAVNFSAARRILSLEKWKVVGCENRARSESDLMGGQKKAPRGMQKRERNSLATALWSSYFHTPLSSVKKNGIFFNFNLVLFQTF